MNQGFQMELLKNAVEIGEEIIQKATVDSNGMYWRNVISVTQYDDLETGVNETLYNGVSGILLFFVELYKTTKSEHHLECINSTAQWLIKYCQKNAASHGFYQGRMGVVDTLMKVSQLDRREYYREKAIEIALAFKNVLEIPVHSFNLFNGLAGTILGLLNLHAEIQQNWILDAIHEGSTYLIKAAKSTGNGFYWDIHYADGISRSTKPLCSMPLGSSGIGHLFSLLSQYFNNSDYLYIAKQAFDYEDQYLNKVSGNWPDFQIDIKEEKLKKLRKSYEIGNHSSFNTQTENNTWMFGLIGIGFTRLSTIAVTSNKNQKNEFGFLIDKLVFESAKNHYSNHTLATGKTSLGLLFLELSFLKNESKYKEIANNIAEEAIKQRESKRFYQFGYNSSMKYEDDSLLMGSAGIGYFFLKLLREENNSVIFPSLPKVADAIDEHELHRFNKSMAIGLIVKTWYPVSSEIVNADKAIPSLELEANDLMHSVSSKIEEAIEVSGNLYLKDAYNYEKHKQNFERKISANYCLYRFCNEIESFKTQRMLANPHNQDLMRKTLMLNPYVEFAECKWNWVDNYLPENSVEDDIYILFAPDGKEYILSELQDAVLQCFHVPSKVNDIYNKLIEANEVDKEELEDLRELFLNIIRSFIDLGVLIVANTTFLKRLYARLNK